MVRRTQPWGLDSSNRVSGEPGAVQQRAGELAEVVEVGAGRETEPGPGWQRQLEEAIATGLAPHPPPRLWPHD